MEYSKEFDGTACLPSLDSLIACLPLNSHEAFTLNSPQYRMSTSETGYQIFVSQSPQQWCLGQLAIHEELIREIASSCSETRGQIKNNDSADDVKNVDLTKVHYLSGPFEIETAEPGDVLLLEIQDIQPMQEQPWGFTGVFDKDNGGGFLDEMAKAIWDFEGIFCSSRHIPGVRFPGLIHPGILGCAPSAKILQTWNEREANLINTTSLKRTVAQPPEPQNAHAGSAPEDVKAKVGKEGARTIPGRPEHGGNCDIKNLSRGSKVYLPVHVKGAKFSVGDLHFSQGDGEISFCGAIEMAGVITMKFTVMKNGMKDLGMVSPMFLPGPVEPHYGPGRYLTFEGFSVDEHGQQHYLDATVAYRQACLRVIEYLRRFV
ncbi:MAG: hypothetical protein LQ340_000265 [Diploschistes diacapsis]|nr:MAG: hypothetical protein LQ340_000265 [Diploschistes diacapsis]